MKKVSLSKLTNDELVARYVEIGAAQAEALDNFDTAVQSAFRARGCRGQ